MRQHSIDLMPSSIRSRTRAGVRRGRLLAAGSLVLLMAIIGATHSRLRLVIAHERLLAIQSEAKAVIEIDRKATELKADLARQDAYFRLYQKTSFPLDVSAVIATLISALPESVTLDQLDIDAGVRASGRSPRSKSTDNKDAGAQRLLLCEISGFAASDEHIAHLVSRLENTAPFRDVNLDFSRTKIINERDAREFRLSFKVDLGVVYDVTYADARVLDGGEHGR